MARWHSKSEEATARDSKRGFNFYCNDTLAVLFVLNWLLEMSYFCKIV